MIQPSLLDKKISPAEKINSLVQLRMDEFNPWFGNDEALPPKRLNRRDRPIIQKRNNGTMEYWVKTKMPKPTIPLFQYSTIPMGLIFPYSHLFVLGLILFSPPVLTLPFAGR